MIRQFAIVICLIICCSCSTLFSDSPEQSQFKTITYGANRIIIYTDGLTHRGMPTGKKILDTDNLQVISDWLDTIKLVTTSHMIKDKQGHAWEIKNCECSGEASFMFLKNSNSVLSFSIHHYDRIRSPMINKGRDTGLSKSSAKAMERKLHELIKNSNKVLDAAPETATKAKPAEHHEYPD